MLPKNFYKTPVYGLIPKNREVILDEELLGNNLYRYILKGIKIWYGIPNSEEENLEDKNVIGIKFIYQDLITKKNKITKEYCGNYKSNSIIIKELELKHNDYFTQFNIDFNSEIITHLKLMTKSGELLEVGEENEESRKIVEFNSLNGGMIHSFFGYYDKNGIRSLGFNYIFRKDHILIDFIELLWLKRYFKKNKEEKIKWEKPENLDKLSNEMKPIVKLCLLPDSVFFSIMKYLN